MIKILGRINSSLEKQIHFTKNNNIFGFFVDYSEEDICKNQVFNVLYSSNIIEFINIKLVHITNESSFEMDFIEKGYKTICFFDFSSKSNLINQIPIIDDWYDELSTKVLIANIPDFERH